MSNNRPAGSVDDEISRRGYGERLRSTTGWPRIFPISLIASFKTRDTRYRGDETCWQNVSTTANNNAAAGLLASRLAGLCRIDSDSLGR